MIIVDNALQAREKEGRPIRVALIGAGFAMVENFRYFAVTPSRECG